MRTGIGEIEPVQLTDIFKMRMRSSSCPHIDFLGTLNRQLAKATEPSPARLQELNDILLTLHTMLPQSCGDEGSTKADEDDSDEDDNGNDDGGEGQSNGGSQYSSVPGLVPAANGQHVQLLDHQLLSIGYTLLAVKIELKSLCGHLPEHTKLISKLESQIDDLECERMRKLKILGAAHDGIGKTQMQTPLDALGHMSPLKAGRPLMGSVEVIDEIPDDDEAATFRTAAPLAATTAAGVVAPSHAHPYSNGHAATTHTPDQEQYRRGVIPQPSLSLQIPGSLSVDGTSTGNSSIWHVTPVHQVAGAGAAGPGGGGAGLSYPSHPYEPALRARSDDFLTDSDTSEFPSGRQSLQRGVGAPPASSSSQRLPQHHASMGSLHRSGGGGGGGGGCLSASHWSLKSNPLGTSPYPLASSLMTSHGSGSSALHMSLESLPPSPKVANGVFEQPPSRRMSIVGRRSVTKFSAIRCSLTSSSASATTPGSDGGGGGYGDGGDEDEERFPSLPSPAALRMASENDAARGAMMSPSLAAGGGGGGGRIADTIDRTASHPDDYDADDADAQRHRQPKAFSHAERVNHINVMLKEKFGEGVQLSSANGAKSHSPSPVPAREVPSRSRSGRRHSGRRAARRSSSPTTVVVHADGTVRMSVQRRSSSRRQSRALSAASFTSAKIDQRLATLQELVRIEQEYIAALQTVQSVYAAPMSSMRILSSQEKIVIFPRELLAIQRRHERFLQSLEACLSTWSASSMLGSSFNILSSQEKQNHSLLSCYRKYLDNFPDAMQLLSQKMRVSECVRSFVEEASATALQAPDLSTLLVRPIKRFPQYIAHIKALLKSTPEGHPDKKPLLQAVQVLNNALPAMQESVQSSAALLDVLGPEQCSALQQARDSVRQSLRYSSHTKAKAEQRSRKRASIRNRYSERPIDVDGLDNLEPGHNSLSARRMLGGVDGETRPAQTRRKPSRKLSLKFMVNAWQHRSHQQAGDSSGSADTGSIRSSSSSASGGTDSSGGAAPPSTGHGHHHHNVRVKRHRPKVFGGSGGTGGGGSDGGGKGLDRSKTFSAGDRKARPEQRLSKSRSVESVVGGDAAAAGGLASSGKNAFKSRSCLTMPGRYDKQVQLAEAAAPAPARKDQRSSSSSSGGRSSKEKAKRRNSSKGDNISQAREQSAKLAAEKLKRTSQTLYVPETVELLPESIAGVVRADDVAGGAKNDVAGVVSAKNGVVGGRGDVVGCGGRSGDVVPAAARNGHGDDMGGDGDDHVDGGDGGGGSGLLEKRRDAGVPDSRHKGDASTSAAASDGRRVKRLKSSTTSTSEIADHCKVLTNAIISEFGKQESKTQNQHRRQQREHEQDQEHAEEHTTAPPSPNHFQSPHRARHCAIRGPSRNSSPANSPLRIAYSPHRTALAHRKLPTMRVPGTVTPEHATTRDHGDGSHTPVAVARSYKMAAVNLPQSPLSKKNSVASFGDVAVVPGSQNGGAMPSPISLPSVGATTPPDLSDSVFTPSPGTVDHDSSLMTSPGHAPPPATAASYRSNKPAGSSRTLPSGASRRVTANGGGGGKGEELSLFSLPDHPSLPRAALTNGLAKTLAQPGFSYAPSASGRNIVIVKGPKRSKHTVLLKLKFWKKSGGSSGGGGAVGRSGGKGDEVIA